MRPRLDRALALLAGFAFPGCGSGGATDSGAAAASPVIHVDATAGSDVLGDGSPEFPFKSIKRGLQGAGLGDTVHVGPGTYDEANGEHFPIIPGFGVTLEGTEIRTMEGTARFTHVVGGGFWSGDLEGRLHATIIPNDGDRIVGLRITNPQPAVVDGAKPAAVLLAFSGATVESCAMQDSDRGVRMVDPVSDTLLKDCAFVGDGIGIFVDGGGTGNRVEGCLVKDNGVGVMCFTGSADFGGGPTGSVGGNAFVANASNDFVHFTGVDERVPAANCFWDHAPPSLAVGAPAPVADTDVWVYGPGGVTTTGASLYVPSGTGVVPPGGGTASP